MKQPLKPRYYDDEDMAAISEWLRLHGYTAHVALSGNVTLKKKEK